MRISWILRELSIPANLYGYNYIRTALELMQKDETLMHRITKGLYPQVAEIHHTTPARVERAIRVAVEGCFNRSTPDVLKKYFGNIVDDYTGRVTNSEFLATLLDHLKEGNKK